jgi:aminoglycoside phosphotransferase (APT) family kinase protein
VHGDLRLGNVLFHLERVSAVIDIEAVGSGTRAFDYATLLDHEPADEHVVQLLVDAASQVAGPSVLAYSFGHVVLDLAQFVHSRQFASDPSFVDQRLRSLATRTQLVAQMLSGSP